MPLVLLPGSMTELTKQSAEHKSSMNKYQTHIEKRKQEGHGQKHQWKKPFFRKAGELTLKLNFSLLTSEGKKSLQKTMLLKTSHH